MNTVYVSRFCSWAPGLAAPGDWDDWAAGRREIAVLGESPALDFSDTGKLALAPKEFALFKRRLSQISRMTIHVLHELLSAADDVKTVFVSFRGEIQQQFKINRMLIEDGELSPAAFSQSVFNTPPALASIALGLTAGYTAVYPANGRFDTGFQAAAAPLLSGATGEVSLREIPPKEIALVYADELCPDEYKCRERYAPLAFAAMLKTEAPGIPVSQNHQASPEEFLKYLYRNRSGV